MIKVINENGVALMTLTFQDTSGTIFVPVTSYWQLMKPNGAIVNNRTFDLNSFSGTTVVLSGNDLKMDDTGDVKRIFAVQGTFNSSIGSGLPFTAEFAFNVRNLYSQTY